MLRWGGQWGFALTGHSYRMWAQLDVLGLFLDNVGSISANAGLRRVIFSPNVGMKTRCSWAGRFMLSGNYI